MQKIKMTQNNRVVFALFSRIIFSIGFQLLFTIVFFTLNSPDPLRLGANWWVAGITLTNIASLFLIANFMKSEGKKLKDIWKTSKTKTDKIKDLKYFGLFFLFSGPIMLAPNLLIGYLLWGNAQVGADLSFQAIPIWAAWLLVIIFPITQGLAELTVYFGYVMPRLEKIMENKLYPLIICSTVLALQHVFLPLLFDWKYIVWRALMFLPFAFLIGYILQKRPTVLPYMMVAHGIMDMSVPIMILIASMAK